ncbi:hypothetical protein DFJ77DRAFT_477655 [Powellomyces hirtus]|nr:hypothetical protein DFJ77DRAFT_477655 [Powellomyces hirtus]
MALHGFVSFFNGWTCCVGMLLLGLVFDGSKPAFLRCLMLMLVTTFVIHRICMQALRTVPGVHCETTRVFDTVVMGAFRLLLAILYHYNLREFYRRSMWQTALRLFNTLVSLGAVVSLVLNISLSKPASAPDGTCTTRYDRAVVRVNNSLYLSSIFIYNLEMLIPIFGAVKSQTRGSKLNGILRAFQFGSVFLGLFTIVIANLPLPDANVQISMFILIDLVVLICVVLPYALQSHAYTTNNGSDTFPSPPRATCDCMRSPAALSTTEV